MQAHGRNSRTGIRPSAAKDADALRELLADPIDFRALTPNRNWTGSSPREVVDDVVLGHWFEPSDHIDALVSVSTGRVADCDRVAYRLRVHNDDGHFLVEQQAYHTIDRGGRIDWLRILCSGYRPVDPLPE